MQKRTVAPRGLCGDGRRLRRAVAAALLCATAPGAGTVAAAAGGRGAGEVRASARAAGGLKVTAVASARVVREGARERFTVEAADPAARGALGFAVAFGDGTGSSPASSQVCLAEPRPAHRTWHLSHRYARRGAYDVRVSVHAVCSPGTAVVRLRLVVP